MPHSATGNYANWQAVQNGGERKWVTKWDGGCLGDSEPLLQLRPPIPSLYNGRQKELKVNSLTLGREGHTSCLSTAIPLSAGLPGASALPRTTQQVIGSS